MGVLGRDSGSDAEAGNVLKTAMAYGWLPLGNLFSLLTVNTIANQQGACPSFDDRFSAKEKNRRTKIK